MKDVFGNTLNPGDYFCYSALNTKRVCFRVGRVPEEGARRKVATQGRRYTVNPDGSYSWSYGWQLLVGAKPGDVIRLQPEDVPQELKEMLA